jgi:hypothetical protein
LLAKIPRGSVLRRLPIAGCCLVALFAFFPAHRYLSARTGAQDSRKATRRRDQGNTTGYVEPDSQVLKFGGEAKQHEKFEKPLGGGLVFGLAPNGDGWPTGWEIRVAAGATLNEKADDFVWVVTPPYHSSNTRYLDTQYGIRSNEAVAWTPRDFSFVLSAADYQAAAAAVDKVLYAKTVEDEQEGLEELGKITVGTGTLAILDSRVTEGKSDDDFGAIEWIKFEVELRLPCSFPVAKELAADRSFCSASAKPAS